MTQLLIVLFGSVLLFQNQTPAPTPRPPYRVGAITVTNGEVSLAGTVTVPEGPGPFPAVVLLTGSGAQNRDEEIFGFKIFAVLADHLTRQGFVVYRYDDRGVGGSTGNLAQSTTEDSATDALAAIAALQALPTVDPKRVGLLGHSEGAVAAAIAAARSTDVAFIVMLAGPSLPGDVVTRRQAADAARAMGADEAAVAAIVSAHQALTEAVRAGADRDGLANCVKGLIRAQFDALPATQRAALGDREAYIEKTYRPHAASLASPAMRFLLTFDPATALARVTVPVYAAFGALDTQVPPSANEGPMRAALAGKPRVTIKVYPHANHLFQEAKTGAVTEYASLDKRFVTPLLDDLATWMKAATAR